MSHPLAIVVGNCADTGKCCTTAQRIWIESGNWCMIVGDTALACIKGALEKEVHKHTCLDFYVFKTKSKIKMGN